MGIASEIHYPAPPLSSRNFLWTDLKSIEPVHNAGKKAAGSVSGNLKPIYSHPQTLTKVDSFWCAYTGIRLAAEFCSLSTLPVKEP